MLLKKIFRRKPIFQPKFLSFSYKFSGIKFTDNEILDSEDEIIISTYGKKKNKYKEQSQSILDKKKEEEINLLIFPVKSPIFSYNHFLTKIPLTFYNYLKENKITDIGAFTLKEENNIKNLVFEDIEKAPLTEQPKVLPNIRNVIFDESLSEKDYIKEKKPSTLKYFDNIFDLNFVGTHCVISLYINESIPYLVLEGRKRIKLKKEFKKGFISRLKNNSADNKILNELKYGIMTYWNLDEQTDKDFTLKFTKIIELYFQLKEKIVINVPNFSFAPNNPLNLYIIAGFLCTTNFFKFKELQTLIEASKFSEFADLLLNYLQRYSKHSIEYWEKLEKSSNVPMDVNSSKKQMEELYNYLKKTSAPAHKSPLLQKLEDKIKGRKFPDYIQKIIDEELSYLQELNESHPDFNIKRNFLDLITDIPFGIMTEDNFDIEKAKNILDDDHFGLEEIKERILEFIAVSKIRGNVKGKTILFVGPPGTGKTSIAHSVAKCLNRKFTRISLGGETDVAIIKGHRKTYIGAYPGKIVQALKNLGTENPVILLDEIDKIGRGIRGSIQDTLLEVLDPVQNFKFFDNYLDTPVDVSKVLFLCSANLLDTIHPALLDRMEKGTKYLIPKSMKNIGLTDNKYDVKIENETIDKLINEYAREAGVRNLERIFEKIGLKIITKNINQITVYPKDLIDYIGLPIFSQKRMYEGIPPAGIISGLAYNAYGGSIIYIETMKTNFNSVVDKDENNSKNLSTRKGVLKLTGSLGDVMQESVQIAYTYAKFFCSNFFDNYFLENNDVHIHFPEGASKKDGPSAGIAITTSLISLALNTKTDLEVAMTGEISLTGKVLKIGGVKEKILAAKREKIYNLIFPLGNQEDVEELKDYIKKDMNIKFVDNYYDVVSHIFKKSLTK